MRPAPALSWTRACIFSSLGTKHEAISHHDETTAGNDSDGPALLPQAAVAQTLQGMSDSFLGNLRRPFSHAANSPVEKESESLHALIRAGSSGRGAPRTLGFVRRHSRLYLACRKADPHAVATQLNRFYEVASQAIFRQDGTLDKLVGDQVMAFFGPPLDRMKIMPAAP